MILFIVVLFEFLYKYFFIFFYLLFEIYEDLNLKIIDNY